MKTIRINREGFWGSGRGSLLPMPQASETKWKGRALFLKRLHILQESGDTRAAHYKGWSTCRICGCNNGSVEFTREGWRWPAGFIHYVEEHNVRPSLAFQEFVIGEVLT